MRLPKPRLPRRRRPDWIDPYEADQSYGTPRPEVVQEDPEPPPPRRRIPSSDSLARARSALGSAGAAVGRGLRRAGSAISAGAGAGREAVARGWHSLPLRARQGIAAAIAVLALGATLALLVVPNLPCEFPGGDECPPPDDAIAAVPEDALAYLHANIDPESDQGAAARSLQAKLPTLTAQLLGSLPGPVESVTAFAEEIDPWLEGELAFAAVPGSGGEVESLILFEVGDEAGAREFADSVAADGATTAFAEGFLLVGTEESVAAGRQALGGDVPSLEDDPEVEALIGELPEERLAEAYVSRAGVQQLLAGRDDALGTLEAFVDFGSSEAVAASVSITGSTVEVVSESSIDEERAAANAGFFDAFAPFEAELDERASAEALAYLGVGNPEQSFNDLLGQAVADAPGLALGFQGLVDTLADAGIDFERDLLPILGGELSVTIEPGKPAAPAPDPAPGIVEAAATPYLSIVADGVEEASAREALAELQGPIIAAFDPGEGLQAPVFEETDVDGVAASSLQISPVVEITFAVFEGLAVVASNPAAIAQLRSGDGGLTETEAYEAVTEGFPDASSLIAYFDLDGLVRLAEVNGLAQSTDYLPFAEDIGRLETLGLSVAREEGSLQTRLRLIVE